jgi:ribonuclease HI
MRYLKGTMKLKLHYSKDSSPDLIGYSDASFAEEEGRKSTTGYVFLKNGGPISWRSAKQSTVALSSTEAEYMALSAAAQEGLHLKFLEAEIKKKKQLVIFEDNQSAIFQSENKKFSHRSKHIEVRHHFIREQVEKEEVKLIHVPSEKMLADILTKPLGKVKHELFTKGLGLVE